MKRLLAVLSVLLLATGCDMLPINERAPVSTPTCIIPEPVSYDVPSEIVQVWTEVRLYDDQCVEVVDEFEGDFQLTAHLTPDSPEDAVRYADIIDPKTLTPVSSPHRWTMLLPLNAPQNVEVPGVSDISIEATVTVPGKWTLICRVTENGVRVDAQSRFNATDLPVDFTVICSWPLGMIPPR